MSGLRRRSRAAVSSPSLAGSATVDKALSLLDAFDETREALTVSQLAPILGLNRSTAYRLAQTLVRAGLLDLDPATRQYRLGVKLLRLGYLVKVRLELPKGARPVMEALAAENGETVHLTIHDGNEGVHIEKVEPSTGIRYRALVGRRMPLHVGASMKILMAYLPDEKVEEIIETVGLRSFTPNTITEPARLRNELAAIRAAGYATSKEESEAGALGVAAPIRNHAGEVAAGLGMSGPIERMTPRMEQLIAATLQAAAEISRRLGYKAPAVSGDDQGGLQSEVAAR